MSENLDTTSSEMATSQEPAPSIETASSSGVTAQRGPIAIVGVSALFPGSADAGGFWSDILAGSDLITDVPESHWLIDDFYDPDPKAPDKTYARRGSFLSPTDFDPMAFGIPPNIAPATDSAQLLALIVAQQVLQDAAQGQFESLDKSRISVILGVTSAQELLATMVGRLQRPVWVKALRESGMDEEQVKEISDRIADHYVPWQESTFPGLLGNVVAGRIANRFNLGGTNCVTDAACASAFASISMAANELHLGDSDMVIAGGVDTLNDIFMYMCFSKTPALSPTGDCRPFSDQADGTLLGEGLGMVALKRLEDAERDGDRIYAVLRGVGSSSDGRAKSVYAPLAAGQARALRQAYDHAGYGPETVELVEAHGTGTKAGDAAEAEGLKIAFGEAASHHSDSTPWCALGSVKSQIGHTKSAAGAAGLFKVVMALHHKVLPPTIKIDRPNPKLELEGSPFYLSTETRPWIRNSDHPRRASVSSFGFGGSNFHLALEEYRGPGEHALRWRSNPTELVVMTASSANELAERCDATVDGTQHAGFLKWLANNSQLNQTVSDAYRLAIVASDEEDLRAKLGQAAERLRSQPEESFAAPGGIYYGHGEGSPKVAFLFPGQGSQYLSMGADLAMGFEPARQIWDQAAGLALNGGVPLQQVVFPRPVFSDAERQEQATRLTATEWAQPAIGAASLGQLALLRELGITAECVGGHSYGEITALCAAGVLDTESMLRVARRRGELMREAAAVPGAMTAVSATLEEIQALLTEWDCDVTVANHNSPKQVVLSGSVTAIDDVEGRLAECKVKARRVPVATAFHSPLVSASSEPFLEFLETLELETPSVDVYSNAEAAPYPTEAPAIRRQLAEQIAKPVRFVDQIEAMFERGVDTFIEVGPGSVLTNLVRKCLAERPHVAVSLDRKGRHGATSLWHALGQLMVSGVSINFAPLWRDIRPPADPRDAVKPRMALPITGTNYGKVYPPPGGTAALPKPNPPRVKRIEANAPIEAAKAPTIEAPAAVTTPAATTAATPAATTPAAATPAAATAPATARDDAPTPSATSNPESQAAPLMSAISETPKQTPAPESSSTDTTALAAAPTSAAAPASATGPSEAELTWLQAYQEAQRQTVDAHATYQASMADAQGSFLKTMEASFTGLNSLLTGQPAAATQPTQPPATAVRASVAPATAVAPAAVAPTAVAPTAVAPRPAPSAAAVAPTLVAPTVAAPQVLAAPVVAEAPAMPMVNEAPVPLATETPAVTETLAEPASPEVAAEASAAPSHGELQKLMLDVVADKTGYPVEMLELGMDMEADLGIDSIKRVEILSAMREAEPALPEVDTAKMAQLTTLDEIVTFMKVDNAAVATSSPVTGAAQANQTPQAASVDTAVPGPSQADLQALMLEVVADKTGYPAEMLELSMDMEADLGIDSIKRVEILSAMREQQPALPEVDTAKMAQLRTLDEIVTFMKGDVAGGASSAEPPSQAALATEAPAAEVPAPAAPAAEAATSATSAATGPSHAELQALMLNVVADKTGYPAEMLELEMDMEADLGIDSIKRVEILSAMREQQPALPEVDTAKMAQLRTLGQIVTFMQTEDDSGATADNTPSRQGEAAPGGEAVTSGETAADPTAETQPMAAIPLDESHGDSKSLDPAQLQALMLDVVADKTGYPAEMLELSMDMEADLGIDSIKRVEILSAMREQQPDLPEVDTAKMAQLRTLGQIVTFMQNDEGDDNITAEAATTGAATTGAATASADATTEPATVDVSPEAPEVATLEAPELMPADEALASGNGAGASSAQLGRFALREVDAPAAGLAMAGLAGGGRVVVTDDGTGIAEALTGRLVQRGLAAEVVDSVPADAKAVIFLGGLRPLTSLEEGLTVNRQAFRAAQAVAAAFTAAERGVFVTVQDTGGDFGLSGHDMARAALGGLAGLTKTAAREWPGAAVKAIDLDRGGRSVTDLADALVAELLEGGPEIEVGLHADGRRTTLESIAAPLGPERSSNIGPESVILASGGARGVTAATLIALARKAGPRMVLLGRTPLEDEPESCRGVEDEAALKRALLGLATEAGEKLTPKQLGARANRIRAGREIRATLAALEAAGSLARYLTADVRDVSTLAAALDTVRREWGSITGIVHGAGVIADKAIAEKTQDQYDRVFDTKVDGLMRLLEATFGDPIDLLCLFSSVTARCGNTGQSDYAMANEVLNKIAAAESRRRGPACRVKSLNWGPWEGGMVTPELETRFAELGVALIPLATGAQMMVDELTVAGDAANDIEVVLGGAPTLGTPADGASENILEMDAFVSRQTHAFLDSHVIGGSAVFPVVLALEWFHRLARAHRPDLEIVACRDIKVLRGIRLERFADGVEGLSLSSRQLTNGSGCELALELRDNEGRPRYRALVDMAVPGDEPRPIADPLPPLDPWTTPAIYGGALFHGPALQVIREVEGVSAQSIAGQLTGGREMGWGTGWKLDAAVLDGGLQLAVLWFEQALHGASLPLGVGSLRSYVDGPLSGTIRAVAHCQERDANRATANIVFSDDDGSVVAELRGVELVRRPDEEAVTPQLGVQESPEVASGATEAV